LLSSVLIRMNLIDTINKDGYVVIDDFLYTDVTNELHQLAINHTQVDDKYKDYYSINFDRENFPFPILPDVINAIHGAFSPLHSLEFDRGWAFVCDNKGVGVTPHSDPAVINVNLWVTPNKCIDDPNSNGLIIYDKKRPEDWTYDQYNSDVDGISEYLKESGANPRLISYNYNRIILFDSKYFHKTNGVSMLSGHSNRRVNYTFMFK